MSARPDRAEALTTASLRRFFVVLAETIRGSRPEYLERAFTVAEIYQSLIPYRTHRDRLGIEMNGDYEDLLLRLLAGEGGFLLLESEPVRDRIQRELERKNPNTGIYREFAAAEVRLNPEQLPDQVDGPEPGAASGDRESGAPAAGSASPASSSEGPAEPRAPRLAASPREASSATGSVPSGTGSEEGDAPTNCPSCDEPLPSRQSLQFCPFCGKSTTIVPCGVCGEDLERGWRFCVACGARAT